MRKKTQKRTSFQIVGEEQFKCNHEFSVLHLCRFAGTREMIDNIKISISLKLLRILFILTRFFESQLNGLSLTSQSPRNVHTQITSAVGARVTGPSPGVST